MLTKVCDWVYDYNDMCNYLRWNDEIYQSFFIDDVVTSHQMFSIDEYRLKEIGEKLNIVDPIKDFEKSVLQKIGKYKNDKYCLSLNINLSVLNNNVPVQTAIIAFLIYIAGKTLNEKKYNPNAYWPKLEDVVREHFGEPYIQELKSNKDWQYQYLFADFAQKISLNHNINFEFENPFSWKHVGIPMFQAMITSKDYCIITQKFEEYREIKNKPLYNYVVDSSKYSSIFKTIKNTQNPELKKSFCEKIEHLYKNWDGTVYIESEDSSCRKRKFINLLYEYYQIDEENFDFYYTAEARNDYGNIKYKNKEFVKKTNEKYYQRIPIDSSEVTLKEISYDLNIPGFRRIKRDYIKLKKEVNTFI